MNKSNTITNADATLITQAIAGNPAALLTFNTSWRFVPTTHVFANPNIPWGFPEKIDLTGVTSNVINQNFTAIKIGDVNGTANPQLKPGPPVVWTVNDQLLTAGETIKVTFRAANFSDIAAYQFALGFDPSQLELADIQSAGVLELTDDNFGAYNVQDGELRAVWNAELGKTLSDGTTVFTVEFVALESGLKLSEVLHLDNSIVEAQAFNTDLVGTDVQLVFSPDEVSGTTDPLQQQPRVTLLQNIPNPFVGQTTIGFVLPETCEARLRIIDINGRVVAEVNKAYAAGYQQEIFELTGYTGVLCYELATPFGTVTRKMTSMK